MKREIREVSKSKVYPRIWDRSDERKIIGETRISWLVDPQAGYYANPIKVNKKDPNQNKYHPQWFFDEDTRKLEVWAANNFSGIKEALGRYSREVDAATLHRVAEVIGYMPTLNSAQPTKDGAK